ncbi:MAG: SDR family NAD(P)-dependent oxidoreductase [Kofleriaceae bacterium]
MSKRLNDRVAIVTGAGSGIGQEVAYELAREGAKIVVSDIAEAAGIGTIEKIRKSNGAAIFVKADAGSAADHEALVAATMNEYGRLDIAVNNAGIGGPSAPIGEYPVDGWDKVIGVNLSGVFYGMRYQIPAMLKSGGGSIVNIASVLGQVGFRDSTAYVASKHGVVGLTKSAALEYGPKKVRINAVGPGFIYTPLLEKNLSPEALKFLEGQHAMGRLGQPAEVAALVRWLASDESSFVTGGYYAVDGGYLAQ